VGTAANTVVGAAAGVIARATPHQAASGAYYQWASGKDINWTDVAADAATAGAAGCVRRHVAVANAVHYFRGGGYPVERLRQNGW